MRGYISLHSISSVEQLHVTKKNDRTVKCMITFNVATLAQLPLSFGVAGLCEELECGTWRQDPHSRGCTWESVHRFIESIVQDRKRRGICLNRNNRYKINKLAHKLYCLDLPTTLHGLRGLLRGLNGWWNVAQVREEYREVPPIKDLCAWCQTSTWLQNRVLTPKKQTLLR